jgi:holo-[acyl-carrier protein] synthase
MIVGIGTDLVEIPRIERSLARFGERFARRILSDSEFAEYSRNARPAAFLAKRFAAKEAFSKAMGTGLRYPVRWRHIIVGHDHLGKPVFRYSDALQPLLDAREWHAHLSITDERSMACAFVVLESTS